MLACWLAPARGVTVARPCQGLALLARPCRELVLLARGGRGDACSPTAARSPLGSSAASAGTSPVGGSDMALLGSAGHPPDEALCEGAAPHAACRRAAQAVNLSQGSQSNIPANEAAPVELTALRTTAGAEANLDETSADTPDVSSSTFSSGANCGHRGS